MFATHLLPILGEELRLLLTNCYCAANANPKSSGSVSPFTERAQRRNVELMVGAEGAKAKAKSRQRRRVPDVAYTPFSSPIRAPWRRGT